LGLRNRAVYSGQKMNKANPYELYDESIEKVKEVTKQINRILSNLINKIKRSPQLDDYDVLMDQSARKLLALQRRRVGIGDTATDEAIVNAFQARSDKHNISDSKRLADDLYDRFHTYDYLLKE